MADRSLVACQNGITLANDALLDLGLDQTTLAARLDVSRAQVNKFFNAKPIASEVFIQICGTLKLDWKEISGRAKNSLASLPTEQLDVLRFSWDDLHDLIQGLHQVISATGRQGESRYDFSDIDLAEKNRLNNLGENYFKIQMCSHHEPHFNSIDTFLKSPANRDISNLYYEIVDELNSKLAMNSHHFGSLEEFFDWFTITAKKHPSMKIQRRVLNVLLSFMYMTCSVGEKQ